MGEDRGGALPRWLSRLLSQIRYALAIHDAAAKIQSGTLGRATGERRLNGKLTNTMGTRNSRCIDRWIRGSNTP